MAKQTQTLVINNFGGRLTRILNGDMNSGFAKFDTSFGYDPFAKPMNLTWLPQPTSVTGIGNTNVVMAGITQPGDITTTDQRMYSYVVDVSRTLYKVARLGPFIDSVVGSQSVQGGALAFQWGAGMEFFGNPRKFYLFGTAVAPQVVASLTGYSDFTLDGTTSLIGNSSFLAGNYHPTANFAGKLIFGNGPSIGAIDNTGTIISSVFNVSAFWGNQYSQLSPALDSGSNVIDLDVSVDGNYLQIASSDLLAPRKGTIFLDRYLGQPVGGAVYGWNGVDQGVTTALNVPFGGPTGLQNFLQKYMLFTNDGLGTSVSDGYQKIVSVPKNQAPFSSATDINGNFIVWMSTESKQAVASSTTGTNYGSLYYYGALDEENPVGLYRMLRYETPLSGGQIYNVPYHEVVSNTFYAITSAVTSVKAATIIKHYFSTFSVNNTVKSPSTAGSAGLFSFIATSDAFNIQAASNQQGAPLFPQLGVYETQTELFSKRTGLSQVRVYIEPPVAGNGFQLDLIGTDGAVITNGTFTYVYGDPIDKNTRINFNPNIAPQYGIGVRITNTGTTNMTFKKIELDVSPEGK